MSKDKFFEEFTKLFAVKVFAWLVAIAAAIWAAVTSAAQIAFSWLWSTQVPMLLVVVVSMACLLMWARLRSVRKRAKAADAATRRLTDDWKVVPPMPEFPRLGATELQIIYVLGKKPEKMMSRKDIENELRAQYIGDLLEALEREQLLLENNPGFGFDCYYTLTEKALKVKAYVELVQKSRLPQIRKMRAQARAAAAATGETAIQVATALSASARDAGAPKEEVP